MEIVNCNFKGCHACVVCRHVNSDAIRRLGNLPTGAVVAVSATTLDSRMKRHRSRGTAMVEFVMCIPLLALLISGMFFFGWAMRNQQKVKVSDRYAVWRAVHNANAEADASSYAYTLYGEPDQGAQRDQFIQDFIDENVIDPTTDILIAQFLGGRADNAQLNVGSGPAETQQQLVDAVSGSDAERLADRTIAGNFPGSVMAEVSSDFLTDMELWEYFARNGGMKSSHVRDGVQWRRWQTSTEDAVRDVFLTELDQAVRTVPDATLQENLRSLYERNW